MTGSKQANAAHSNAQLPTIWPESLQKRMLQDALARYVFTLGGWVILLSICAILLVIFLEVFPLLRPVTYTPINKITIPGTTSSIILDDYKESGLAVGTTGSVEYFKFSDSTKKYSLSTIENVRFSALHQSSPNTLLAATTNGMLYKARITFSPEFKDTIRTIVPAIHWLEPIQLFEPPVTGEELIKRVASGSDRSSQLIAAQVGTNRIILYQRKEKKALIGSGSITEQRSSIKIASGVITALAMDTRADFLIIGTDQGELISYELNASLETDRVEQFQASDTPISALAFAIGGRTLLVGDEAGSVSSWLFVPQRSTGRKNLKQSNVFNTHSEAVRLLIPSQRNKVFASVDTTGTIKIHYATSGNTLATIPSPLAESEQIATAQFSPKADGIFLLTTKGTLYGWDVYNPHPEISIKTLFEPVHYEGYQKPEFVWQSTGGSDTFEPKMSLVPLLTGTLKGTLYALLFAVPLALLAACYVSQFMSPRLKSIIKPALEVMAVLPSVVIGFVAGLWLAPALEPHLIAIFCIPFCITIALVCTCILFWRFSHLLGIRYKTGIELLLAIPVLAFALYISFPFANWIEALLFDGNFNQWLFDNYTIRVDQRNSIIAGIAVGFAVVPIIFTISEDCLSSVPKALSAGSLALGATRWQTALRVILPVAAPGIFAAVMIGLGRAVGETMIVLMATGNTPIIDLSPFTGFRALSANIAVELPEAPHGGTLYRILFLTAFILFIMTFVLNTLSEFVRSHLRKKLGGV